ncbi:MAG: substrate-binding domain-containing protein [Opitutaceae bacterium]|nr:substrate-binding domain-containing protein [Opitutaceae bacterium]
MKASALILPFARTIAVLAIASPAFALKYAPPQYHIPVDPSIPSWQPGQLTTVPEEEFNIVGADIMDEMAMGWVKLFRQAYPRLSVTLEARSSGSGVPALTAGRAHVSPVGREHMPAELDGFVKKFGYRPLEIKVATGSLTSLGKTATTIVLVSKDNPIKGLTFAQLDAMYTTTRNRGHADIKTWGDVGLTGEWASMPIHLYGLRPPNGIEQFFKNVVCQGGDWKPGIQNVKGQGFTHAFTVASHDMATNKGGLTYALLPNVTPDVKVVPLAEKEGDPFIAPTVDTIYNHTYPLSRYVYIYVNRPPGKPLEPKIKEFLKLVLSREGQEQVAMDGVYMPLLPEVVRQELAKLE